MAELIANPIAGSALSRNNPFPGLRPYEEQDASWFYGRSGEINDLLKRLRRLHFVAVVGASGSGKSSLIRAGVLPQIRDGYLDADWLIAAFRPGERPIESLAESLAPMSASGLTGFSATLRSGPMGLVRALEQGRLAAGSSITTALLDRMLNDLDARTDQLPVLQHALMRIWQRAGAAEAFDARAYESVGTFSNCLSAHAEEVFGELDEREKKVAELLFRSITQVSKNRKIRRPRAMSEILQTTGMQAEGLATVIVAFSRPPVGQFEGWLVANTTAMQAQPPTQSATPAPASAPAQIAESKPAQQAPAVILAPFIEAAVSEEKVQQGHGTTLSWNTQNALDIRKEGFGTVALTGSMAVTPQQSTTYKFVARTTVEQPQRS